MKGEGAARRHCNEMERWNDGGRGRGHGMGHGEEEGRFFGGGGGIQDGGFEFDPGYGDGRRHRGRGGQRDYRPQRSRGFVPHHGGFTGRMDRGGRVGRHGVDVPVVPHHATAPEAAGTDLDRDVVMGEEKETSKAGKKEKTYGRCSQKGHLAADCTAQVYCVICDGNDDVNHRCHLLKEPRPVAHTVGYAVTGPGFYHIPHPPLSRKKDSKTALVKVVGGTLSVAQVLTQLQCIISSKWKWEPVAHESDSFVESYGIWWGGCS